MYTRRCFESTHGVIASSAYQEKPTYSSHLLQRGSPKETKESYPFFVSLREGRQQHVPDSSNHSLYLMKLFNSSSPEGNCGGEPAVRWLDLSIAPAGIKRALHF